MTSYKTGRQRGYLGSPVLTSFLKATASTHVGTGGAKAVADEGWRNGESTVDSIWSSCLRRLSEELAADEFHAWIRPLQPRFTDGHLELLAPNRYVRERVEDDYLLRIAELVAEIDEEGRLDGVDLVVGSRERQPGTPLAAPRRGQDGDGVAEGMDGDALDGERGDRGTAATPAAPRREVQPQGLNPGFVFDAFVAGTSNDFAKGAAYQAAEHPGRSYNPLLLYGGVGLGKTHLMQAVGNEVLRSNGGTKVIYATSQGFTNEMVRGIRTGTINTIMERFGSVDALLIDDIQFFADKLKAQEEFFHVFNAVLANDHQIVLTCDRYPREIEGLEERLQSRFVGGLTVEVVPPELETRVAILQKKGEAEGIEVPYEVAFEVAERIRSSVRELEGALTRIIHRARWTRSEVTVELMHRALRDLFAVQVRRITIEKIQKACAEYFNIKQSDMISNRRPRTIARPRQMAMALAKELTNHSLPEIGDRFGGRDHTTVLYACRRIEALRDSDTDTAEDYKNLYRLLNN